MSTMALAFEPDFQGFLNDLHRGPGAAAPPASAGGAAVVATPQRVANPAALYRRRRLGVLVALIIGFVAVSSLVGGTGVLQGIVAPAEASGGEPVAVAEASFTHVVQPGDTLWSVVGDLDIDGDLRAAVHAVAEANGGATLVPGQVLDLDAALG